MGEDETIDVVDTYEAHDQDFKTTIAKLRTKKFDALGVCLTTGQISQFYKQSKLLRYEAMTFGTHYFNNTNEIADADGAMKGALFVAPFVDGNFATRYENEYGSDVHVTWAANAYEFAMLVARLFGSGKSDYSSEEIISKFKNSKAMSAGASVYDYIKSKDGSGFDFKMVMRKIEKDRIVDITK